MTTSQRSTRKHEGLILLLFHPYAVNSQPPALRNISTKLHDLFATQIKPFIAYKIPLQLLDENFNWVENLMLLKYQVQLCLAQLQVKISKSNLLKNKTFKR